MKAMELKVWVDGVQRIVCGVTEFTTCQEVVIALAQAIGRTGRYTLIEKWRDTERHLAPHENPVVSLNKWGQYASDVQLILHRTGPSGGERPPSDGLARGSERAFHRQSLPPMAKLHPSTANRSLRRREPKRKSVTFSGGTRGLREIFGKSRDPEAKHSQRRGVSLNLRQVSGGGTGGSSSVPGSPSRELGRLVRLQRDKLQVLESRLLGCEAELREWEEASEEGSLEEELLLLEQQVRRNDSEMDEEEFWQNELRIEQESERQLRQQLAELQARVRDCEAKLSEYIARIQSMESSLEQERLLQDDELSHMIKEEEVFPSLRSLSGGGPTGEGDNRVGCAEPAHGSPGERLQGVGTLARPVMQETPGEGTGAGAADQRASPGQPAAVHSADGHQGHRAAGSATSRGRRRGGPVRLVATSLTHRPALPAEHHRIRTQPRRHLRLNTGNT
ncbi:ras association domain-containing protein 8b isoform X1 [Hippocampus comes]|uniref:ras association domain-containing protein 8b isoform X1 n=1 Tax=Hippocampus comes TaxID=109280 RepID=UPI00094F1CAF|nr:PREDICTED: ras association domain-containing protein 8-like isoform X1 [Hippocampus comes]XP_019732612.1 PREDICTED: ras association domain-containing protein 8-like isoform X1 [Hippocampus comes]XP_019732613.1 PREDICTED: ras association domain-containing protein 8-like isoform X1 [Hippocampus comes]XP_019732614.1 PREDICTED: ras association domain-containing protein 8-like isoform X1 [Hippocampus comes]XP_019732615.1 PREDICTED: ras association domain-containing protein 8-like isoform X1 [Hipp